MGKEKDINGNYYSDWKIVEEKPETVDKEKTDDSENESVKSENFVCTN